MAVIVGSARIDEHGKSGWAGNAKAGDQTKKEVSTQDWYLHKQGWVVLRAKEPDVAEKIAQDMQWACDNNHIGYDQSERSTLYNLASKVGFNCSKVTQNCETDCSALVRVCVKYAGIEVGNFRTYNEAQVLMATGAFTKLTDKKYTESSDYLQRGDILVTKTSGHTVVVLSNGSKAVTVKQTTEDKVTEVKATSYAAHFDKDVSGTYVTTGKLNLRNAAGVDRKNNDVLVVMPAGTKVYNHGFYSKVNDVKWLYVETIIDDVKYIGFCSEKYLEKE